MYLLCSRCVGARRAPTLNIIFGIGLLWRPLIRLFSTVNWGHSGGKRTEAARILLQALTKRRPVQASQSLELKSELIIRGATGQA
jgi:hypothetical protein